MHDASRLPKKPETNPADFPNLHNIAVYYARLEKALARMNSIRPYQMEILGNIDTYPLYLLTPTTLESNQVNILSAGGFHGDESAGPWGILEYLETAEPEQLIKINHSFLPLVNPTGFASGERLNRFGENPNRGFVAVPPEMEAAATGNNSVPSAEGKILMQHFMRILDLSRDGFVTQHEDWRLSEGFVFCNEYVQEPSPLPRKLRDVIAKYFTLVPDGGNEHLPDAPIKDGLWMHDEDSSFECLLHYRKIPCVVTTETPGQLSAIDRIECNKEIAAAFANFHLQQMPIE